MGDYKIYLEFIYHVVVTLCLLVYYSIIGLLKLIVPYTYRSKDVKGEIVLITGAGSGLGKLMANKLAKLGARLVLIDVDEKANQKTANEILNAGGNAKAFTCDLSDRKAIYVVADEIKKTIGNVDILINNAGIVTGKKFLESSDSAIEKTLQVNTMAHFWLAKSFLPNMIEKNHGHVVTVASMAGIFGTAGLCDYCASKFAAVGFDESLRNELIRLGKTGVKTTVICPYFINTGMFDGVKSYFLSLLEPEYVVDKIIEAILTDQKILMLPRFMYLLYFFKGFIPPEVENYVSTNGLKTNTSMDNFVGRKKD